jgi:hypothetical protein
MGMRPLKMTAITRSVQPTHCHPATATPQATATAKHAPALADLRVPPLHLGPLGRDPPHVVRGARVNVQHPPNNVGRRDALGALDLAVPGTMGSFRAI